MLATLSASRSRQPDRATASPPTPALTSGYHLAFWIAAGLVVLALVVALTVLQPEARAAAGREGEGELARAESEAA